MEDQPKLFDVDEPPQDDRINMETVEHCATYLREFAMFLYETIEDKNIANVMSMAMSKASIIVEDLYFINNILSQELRSTLKKGEYDEDSILRALAEWRKYVNG